MQTPSVTPARRIGTLAAAALALTSGLAAQTVPTGYQEYYIVGREQHVWNMLTRVQTGEGGGGFASGTNSVVSAIASADGQVIRYDHWEDGYEADLLNPPFQATTLLLGDGDTTNGRACDFTTDPRIFPCDGVNDDVLFQGSFVNLNSDQGLAGCPAPPNDRQCSVPVNPRSPAQIRYDGGDRIISSGGPLSLLHPQDPLSPFIGGATEMIPRQAVANATSYTVPVGEDIYGGNNSLTEPFKYVSLDLVAFDDNTQVFVDSPGAGTVSFTLNQGQHWSSLGAIDEAGGPALTINAGTKISTTGPIAGLIFTGGDGTFATRMYTLLPDLLHTTDYVTTAPGDNPAQQGSRPLNLYIVNPDPVNPISVTTTDTVGTSTINIPPATTVDYFTGTGRFVPSGSTVRLTSNRPFWGLSAYDHQSPANDWGHSWLGARFATRTYTVSYAPGVNNPAFQSQPAQRLANDPDCTIPPAAPVICDTLNRSPVFVAALENNTQVQVDFDNDGVFDVIDLDGDDFPDPAPLPNNTYLINALQSLRIYDHTDYDNSGTQIVASKPVLVAYGQDTDQATGPDPIQDTGYAIYPINQSFLDPVLTIEKTADVSSVPTAGGLATYTLRVRSYDFGPLTSVQVFDLLPQGVVGGDYVPGSTLLVYPNLSQSTADPVASIDPTTGRHRLDWALSPATLGTNQTITVRYSVQIPASPAGLPRVLTNRGSARATFGGSSFAPVDNYRLVQTDVTLTKSVNLAQAQPGDVLTYTLRVANNGLLPETNAVVSDAIPPDTIFVPGSVTSSGPFAGTYSAAQNAVVWSAVNFPVGGPHTLSFQVQVNPGAAAGAIVENFGRYESTQIGAGFTSNTVQTEIVGPALVATKTGPTLLHPNEVATFTINVRNVGAGTANNLFIDDPIPPNTTYVPGSMEWRRNAGAFAGLTDANDPDQGTLAAGPRAQFRLSSLGPNENATFRFRVRVNAGTSGGFVNNQATVASTSVSPFDTNLVQVPIVGVADVTGHVFLDSDGNGVQGPGEPNLANIDVLVSDSTGRSQIVTTDASGNWIATVDQSCYLDRVTTVGYGGSDGQLDWTPTSWLETSDDGSPTSGDVQARADSIGVLGNSFFLNGDPVSNTRSLRRAASLAGFATARLSFAYRRVSLESDDFVSIEVSYNNGATFATLGTLGNGTDAAWQAQSFTLTPTAQPTVIRFRTNNFNHVSDEFWFDDVALCAGNATANVSEADPDFPPGATLSTGNDPQTVTPVAGGTVATSPVGYRPAAIGFGKLSNAIDNQVAPDQVITYTMQITNNTGVTQTGINLSDPLPTGTSYVAGSAMLTASGAALRVTEYFLAAGQFTGTSYNLALNQPLSSDYFAIVQGSSGSGGGGGDRGPDSTYARLTADPFGTGDLATSAGPAVLALQRATATDSWVGVVTVVECVGGCATAGFRLLDVQSVAHAGAATTGTDTSTTPWTALGRTMLMGGFNGAGCLTAETDADNTKTCHVRLFPSGTNTINWTRNAAGATLSTATSTVMVVQWGSEWTVQRVRVQGTNGGDGVNAAGEYNTAAIASVPRARTWVWGTGHTNDNGVGDAAEGVVVTLGNGVTQNANETSVAVATEDSGTAIDFEVWALSHPDLTVSHTFLNDGGGPEPDGDSASLIEDVPVPAAGPNRMALSYNTSDDTDNNYPQPMFSARYLNDTTIRLERRRSGEEFAGWIQGIQMNAVDFAVAQALNAPPGLIVPADGITLAPGATVTVTLQVRVDDPLAVGINQITNSATLSTTQQPGPFVASVTDTVVRLGITVEPNDAAFATAGSSVTYSHVVVNTGQIADSYAITGLSELGWPVQLLDPDTGVVIATDSNGDGVWDGGVTVNTGTLNPGEAVAFELRVSVPGGTPVDTQDTARLRATSDRIPNLFAEATDETTVVDALDIGPVLLIPDQSGVVSAGGSVVYPHRVFNNTGSSDTFDLFATPTLPGWTARFYFDANGDGEFSPGIDIQVSNTAVLPNGGSQLLFVVVTAPVGAVAGDTDVANLAAVSRNNTALLDTASDTTTVLPATTHDLAGGGTFRLPAGGTGIFPGTLDNLGKVAEIFELDIGPSLVNDSFVHPTQLWVDTTGNGIADTLVATDANGDGTWDSIAPGWDLNGDGNPEVSVPGGGQVAYELRRPMDPNQTPVRDPVTLTAISRATGERDSVTATTLVAAATLAVISRCETRLEEGRVVVEWSTASEAGTLGFYLERWDGKRFRRLGDRLLPALLGAPQGGEYRYVDSGTSPGRSETYRLVEQEVWGTERVYGPFEVVSGESAAKDVESLRGRLGRDFERAARRTSVRRFAAVRGDRRAGRRGTRARIDVAQAGLVSVGVPELAAALDVNERTLQRWIRSGRLRLQNRGEAVSWLASPGGSGILFVGEAVESLYTDRNVYQARSGRGSVARSADGRPRGGAAPAAFRARLRLEQDVWPLTSVIEDPEQDYWFWDYLFAGAPGSDRRQYAVELHGLPASGGDALLEVRLQGAMDSKPSPDHHVMVLVNGQAVGEARWDGNDAHTLKAAVPHSLLREGGNVVELAALVSPGVPFDLVYLNTLELQYDRLYRAKDDRVEVTAEGASLLRVDGFSARDVLVLEVSHPREPVLVKGARIETAGGGYSVTFASDPNGRYLVARAAAARPAADVVGDEHAFLASRGNAADVVMIAPAGLEAGAEALAGIRRSEGLEARVVRLQDVYDEFGGGIADPLAIRRFLESAVRRWSVAPRYVVLVGDGTFDHRDRMGQGGSLLPVALVGTPQGLVPSDNRLADLVGDDGVPELAIGRLPVQSPEELDAWVAKAAAYSTASGTWRGRALWIADNPDSGGDFGADAEALRERLPDSLTAEPVYLGPLSRAAARTAILAALRGGVALVSYHGHGGLDRLANEGLLVTSDVATLGNLDRLPVVTALTCVVGRFDLPGYDSLGEALVLREDGGAIALLAPSGFSLNHEADAIGRGFVDALAGNGALRLGDAVRAGLAAHLALHDRQAHVPFLYSLLGDPSARPAW